jgi:signal transduction histidine kinase
VLDPRSLRGRLTLAYVATLVIALVLFAAAVLGAVDQIQRRALDRELEATARALSVASEHERGREAAPRSEASAAALDPRHVEHSDGEHEHGLLAVPPGGERRATPPGPPESEAQRRRRLRDAAQFQLGQLVGLGQNAAVFAPDGSLFVATAVSIPAAVTKLAKARPNALELADGNESARYFRIAALPIVGRHGGGTVVVWRGRDIDDVLDRRLLLVFAFAIPLVAVLGLLGGNAIARAGLRPLQRMAEIASEIEAKDLSGRIGLPPTNDELGRLAESFDRMLDRLQSSFARERRFTSDASHELRAPLSVLRAAADYALLRERDPAEYRRALRTVLAEADELEAVTRDLLAVARAETATSSREAVDVGAIAAESADRLSVLANARRIAIARSLAADSIASGDGAAFARVAIALLHNALKFAREDGRVEVTVASGRDGIDFTVEDDGPGFSPDALQHAVERFWRDDASRSRGQGTGLGLAIAHASIEAMGGSLVLGNRPGGGASVRVRLPRYEASTRSA